MIYNPINALKHEVLLNQCFSNCGTRTTGGTPTVFSGTRAYVSKKKEDKNKPHPFEFILFISPSINAFT
jgi:hypothetical protein